MEFSPINEAVTIEVARFENLAQLGNFFIGYFCHEHSCVPGPAFGPAVPFVVCAKYETAAMRNVTHVILWPLQRKTLQIEGHRARYGTAPQSRNAAIIP